MCQAQHRRRQAAGTPRAVQLQPNLHAARNHLATMHLALGRVVEAATEIAQLENFLADDPRWLLNRALPALGALLVPVGLLLLGRRHRSDEGERVEARPLAE